MFSSPARGAVQPWIVALSFVTLLVGPLSCFAEQGQAATDASAATPATDASAATPAAAPADAGDDPAQMPHPSLARIAICEMVEERVPVGEADRFTSDIGRLWCFTKIVDVGEPTRIFHRWYVGDQLIQEIPMTVEGESWRCWSNKSILSSWTGPCRVEILTESGDVLGTKEFTLTEAMGEGPAVSDS